MRELKLNLESNKAITFTCWQAFLPIGKCGLLLPNVLPSIEYAEQFNLVHIVKNAPFNNAKTCHTILDSLTNIQRASFCFVIFHMCLGRGI